MSPDHISDETLTAFVDDELDYAQAREIEHALENDALLARRVKRLRDVRARMRTAFDPVLQEAVPQRLLDAIGARGDGGTRVTSIAAARAARSSQLAAARTPTRVHPWGLAALAAAASLALGLVLSPIMLRDTAAPFVPRDGELVARGALERALLGATAADTSAAADVRIGLTFREQGGRYCRTFALPAAASAGLACRDGERWIVQAVARSDASTVGGEAYRQAASALPTPVRSAVEARIVGDALDASAEVALIARGWK